MPARRFYPPAGVIFFKEQVAHWATHATERLYRAVICKDDYEVISPVADWCYTFLTHFRPEETYADIQEADHDLTDR